MRCLLFSALALLGVATLAQANGLPRPPVRPVGGREVKFVVEVDPDATKARLVVPQAFMVPGGLPGANPGGFPGANPGAVPGRFGLSTLPTVVIGLSLFLALGSGGVWLARRGKGKIVAGLFVFALLAGVTSSVFADIAPRPKPKPPIPPVPPAKVFTAVKLPADIKLSDKVTIEFVGVGDTVKLIVPKNAVKVEAPKAPEE